MALGAITLRAVQGMGTSAPVQTGRATQRPCTSLLAEPPAIRHIAKAHSMSGRGGRGRGGEAANGAGGRGGRGGRGGGRLRAGERPVTESCRIGITEQLQAFQESSATGEGACVCAPGAPKLATTCTCAN